MTLKRYGTVSSLERTRSEEIEEENFIRENGSCESYDEEEEEEENQESDDEYKGIDNEAFNTTIMNWTVRAGSYVAEKMSFFEKLGEDYKTGSRFLERFVKCRYLL